jgi:DNA phosphorothioation-dependent restriction protein DptH
VKAVYVTSKITEVVAREVVRLHENQTDPSDIAQQLNLKEAQVAAIIAYSRFQSAEGQSAVRNEVGRESRDREIEEDTDRSTLIEEYVSAPEATRAIEELREHSDDEEQGQGIFVGNDIDYSGSLYWNPEDADAVNNPHMMIVGESGSGKTYATLCLTAELAHRGLPTIIFDYAQGFELEQLEEIYKRYIRVQEFRIGEEGISLNPLQIFPKDIKGPLSVATRVSDVFDAVYHLGHIQTKVLIESIISTFERAGILPSDPASWKKDPPNFAHLQQTLDEFASDRAYANAKNAMTLSARLMPFFMLSSFGSTGRTWSWEGLFADPEFKVHVLQFRGLEGKTQNVTLEILLWHLFFFLKSHGKSRLRIYIVLDEAHHLSFREGGPIDLLLREARKFGLGVIFASQQPEDFSQVAFDNTASKLVFQTADPTLKVSRFISAKCSSYDSPESIRAVISVLKQGDALFVTQNNGYRVRIADLRTRATLWGGAEA